MAKKTATPTPSKEHWFWQISNEERETVLSWIEKLFALLRGKVDIKSRLTLLLSPDNIKTSTRLTPAQVRFVSSAHFVAKHFPIFEPLKDFAVEFCETNISLKGLGREEVIRFVGALQESKLLQKIGVLAKQSKEGVAME